jgi:hypothetical protein
MSSKRKGKPNEVRSQSPRPKKQKVAEEEPESLYNYPVQPLGGDSFDVKLPKPRATVNEVKVGVERETGIRCIQQELYKVAVAADGGVVREDDAEPELLTDSNSIDAGEMVTMLAKELVCWDNEWKGDTIELSEHSTVAKCTSSRRRASSFGQGVRSKEALAPKSGTHCFEYEFRNRKNGTNGESLSNIQGTNGWDMLGVISAAVGKESYSKEHGLLQTRWWGLQNYGNGVIRQGGLKTGEDCAYLPKGSTNSKGVAFGSGDKIGFAVDTDHGTMLFYRNGVFLEGSEITGVSTKEPLYLVGCPNFVDTSIVLSQPARDYEFTDTPSATTSSGTCRSNSPSGAAPALSEQQGGN